MPLAQTAELGMAIQVSCPLVGVWCSGAERHLQGIAKKALHIPTCLFDAAAPASIRHFAVFCAWPKSKKGGYVSINRHGPLVSHAEYYSKTNGYRTIMERPEPFHSVM